MEDNKDQLEDFINENRDEFDAYEPSEGLWDKVNKRVEEHNTNDKAEPKMIPLSMLYKVAAVLVLAFSVGLVVIYMNSEKDGNTSASNDNNEKVDTAYIILSPELAYISPELAEVEDYYVTQINYKMKEARSMNVGEDLLEEVEILDKEFQELKEEIGDNIDNERIISAMIENYRIRLNILENILTEIQKEHTDTHENTQQDVQL
jgi:hypothetical protein